MTELTTNLLSAFAVSMIITAMSKVHSQKLKAILYALPFPITIALIGSNSIATSLSISGLTLTGCFLWACYFLHTKLKVNIFVTDVFLSVLYVAIAYILAHNLKLPYWTMLGIYLIVWSGLMIFFRNATFKYRQVPPAKTNTYLKALVIFIIAFGLFSAHQYLAAFVVTFPYNGVFAVFENRFGLLPQAALFTRNCLALAAYFTANFLVGTHYPALYRYAASWVAFGIVLIAVNKCIKIDIRPVKT